MAKKDSNKTYNYGQIREIKEIHQDKTIVKYVICGFMKAMTETKIDNYLEMMTFVDQIEKYTKWKLISKHNRIIKDKDEINFYNFRLKNQKM